MTYVKWFFGVVAALFVFAVLHYTLPQRDIVRVTDTYEKRIDFGENSIFWATADTGNAQGGVNRDVFFIQTQRAGGSTMVYRNEDTGWGWPPYFKFDTANLQAEAADLKSSPEAPKWVLITHYGWRNIWLSIYPNAISVRAIEGPDVGKPIPWFNIIFLTLLAALVWGIWVRVRRFRQARIDPVLEDMGEAWDAVDDRADAAADRARGVWTRFKAWLATWKGKPRV